MKRGVRDFEGRLGLALTELGMLTKDQLDTSLCFSEEHDCSLFASVEHLWRIPRTTLFPLIYLTTGIPFTNLSAAIFQQEAIQALPQELAHKYQSVPIRIDGTGHLRLATTDPAYLDAIP